MSKVLEKSLLLNVDFYNPYTKEGIMNWKGQIKLNSGSTN